MRESDISTRVLAIVMALFLWISVRIVTSPVKERIAHVPLTVGDSITTGYRYQFPNYVDVQLKGSDDVLSNMQPLTATINITNVTSKSQLFVRIDGVPDGVSARTKKVEVIPIQVKPKEMPVDVIFLPKLPPHMSVAEYSVEPGDVTVEGADNDLNLVKYVGVYVDPTSDQIGFTQELTPQALNANGEPIKSVRILSPSIKVRIVLQRQ